MSDFSAHKALEEAHERAEGRGNVWISLTAALLAVLAAIATMLAHSRSTTALLEKNEAILTQAKASDQYNYYESKRIKYHIYNALDQAGIGAAAGQKRVGAVAAHEKKAAGPILLQAQGMEKKSAEHQDRSERALKAYEILEIAVTLFEVSIVFVSISALTKIRFLLYLSGATGAFGAVFLVMGLARHF
ncbi:MAG: hypothetical protein NVS1B14_01580 [Vulcanimicrobiaceae bacterium]